MTTTRIPISLVRLLKHSAVAAIVLATPVVISAQAQRATPEPTVPRVSRTDDPDPMSSIEEEMRAKNAIKHAQKEYRENVERAFELADLGAQLRESFKKNQQLGREDWKKLDRLEKLTKAIRNAAGGFESEKEPDQNPADLARTIKEMITVVDSLAQRVEKTPRHVISAAVIDEANVLLELIRSVRALSPKVQP